MVAVGLVSLSLALTFSGPDPASSPISDPQITALFARSWKLVPTNGKKISTPEFFDDTYRHFRVTENESVIWTFFRDFLKVDVRDSYGRPIKGGLLGFDTGHRWRVEFKTQGLAIAGFSEKPKRYSFVVRLVAPDSLVLELEDGGSNAGSQLTFEGRPREESRNGPPLWVFVLIQVGAALIAHWMARSRATRFSRFIVYLLLQLGVAVLFSPVAYLFPEEDGLLSGFIQSIFVYGTACVGLVFGIVGGLIHSLLPRFVHETADGLRR